MIFSRSQKSFSLHWNKIYISECLKKAINITCTSIYTYVKKAAYMYISTSTHCPYPFHEKEHSWNLIFTYCAGEISSVIEIKSSWFLTIHDGMVVDFIKEQLVKCWHFLQYMNALVWQCIILLHLVTCVVWFHSWLHRNFKEPSMK